MNTMAHAPLAAPGEVRRASAATSLPLLSIGLVLASLFAVGHGAYAIAPFDVLRILASEIGIGDAPDAQQASVLTAIRLPRVVLAMLTGAGLAVAGALMQGMFRNPLADPSLIGVSAGAALAAACVIVLGTAWPGAAQTLGAFTLPLAAFCGALAVTALVYRIGAAQGTLSLPVMLLAGIALNALAMAGVGLLSFVANDAQLRNLTFWNLGSLGGATWTLLLAAGPLVGAALIFGLTMAGRLNALALGEVRAEQLGVDIKRTKRAAILLTALATGSLVACTGVIGFIGLVAPHLIRIACGPDHRVVLPGAALLGATLVLLADLLARTIVVPAELPIGIVTALLGAPFFLALLLHRRQGLG